MDDVAVMAVFDEVVFHFLMGQFATEGINPPVLGTHMFNTINADYCANEAKSGVSSVK